MDVREQLRASPRRGRVAGVAAVALLLAAACSGGGGGDDGRNGTAGDPLDDPRWERVVVGPEQSDTEPVTGGSIVVGLDSETNSYAPGIFQGAQAGYNVAFTIYDPLVTQDAEGNYRPYLAEAVEPNDDFTEWTVTLRPGVRFHDGTTLDAEAMRRIYYDHLLEGVVTQIASRDIERLDVVDGLTVRYVMNKPYAQFPELLQFQFGWPFSPDAADRLGEDFGDQPVGTGPYRFVSWRRDGELVVERNPDYWQEGQPYLDRITFRPIPDDTTRAAALASGDVDAIQSVSLSGLVAEVADMSGVEVVLGPSNSGSGMMFNVSEPPTDDLRVRQALAHAVDQAALIEVAADDAAELSEPRTQFFLPDSPFYSEVVADAWLGYDPDRARALYEDYVNDPQRSDGKEVGEPVSLTVDTTNVPGAVELATAYKGFYEEVGFEVSVNPMEQAVAISTAVSGDYQAKLFRMGNNISPLGEFLLAFDNPEEFIGNFSNFYDDTVADVIERLRSSDELAVQTDAAEEVGLDLAEQVPWQWTGSDLPFIAARDGVEGLRSWEFPDGTLGDGARPGIMFWGQVWLDE